MRVLLAELYAGDSPGDTCPEPGAGPVQLHPMPAPEGPRTYLKPSLEPGIHFHTPPGLATMQGYVFAMYVGQPSAKSQEEARGEGALDDPEGMAAAIVQDVGGRAVSYSVMRGPATAPEGEAHSINAVVTSVQRSDLPPATVEFALWGIGDS